MRSTILTATLLFAMSISSFASEKVSDTRLLHDLSSAFKKTGEVTWVSKSNYRQASFNFNNQQAMAFYNVDKELIGYSIKISKTELPKIVTDAMKDNYNDWVVTDAIMFVDTDGYVSYFIETVTKNKGQILEISTDGDLSVYKTIKK
ncbi:hypothetical protein [Parafilimonas sp.]|jgi:hypothetical protein|uniref:hypothetical protein n=1 Tax=Parafilimonas sp. TaxID=1969739 RepID=UPI003F7CF057